jgi:hypothetical protein
MLPWLLVHGLLLSGHAAVDVQGRRGDAVARRGVWPCQAVAWLLYHYFWRAPQQRRRNDDISVCRPTSRKKKYICNVILCPAPQ